MELTLEQALQKGIEAQKSGNVQEADRYYTAILKANPKHRDANHNMGVLAVGVGKVEAALPFFKTALEVNQTIGQYWLSYIDALIKLDRIDDAKAVFDQATIKDMKGSGFEQLEKQLGLSTSKNSNNQKPSQAELQNLVNLYSKGQVKQVLTEASELLLKFPGSVDLYNITGAANQRLGKLEEAIQAYNKALAINPDYAEAFSNMGNALKEQGKLEEAIDAYNKALSIKPDYAEAFSNMGNALKDQGKLDEAIEAYNKALTIKPYYAEAYYNIGVTRQDQGKLEEAIQAFNKALSIKPDFTEAYYNTGNALKEQGKLEKALEAYAKAISIKPDYADAYNNMGTTLKEQGKLEKAIEAYTKALSTQPNNADAYYNMGIALQGMTFNKPSREIQKKIASLLDKKSYVRPRDIVRSAISLLKLEPTLQKHLQLVDGHIIENPLNVVSDLSEFPLLLKLMNICPLPDLEFEKLFKNLRHSILLNILSLKKVSPELIKFQSALALQCFTNEYIFNHTEEEEKARKALEEIVKKSLHNNKEPSSLDILVLAWYKALNEYEWCKLLVVTDHIQEVFTRQVEEPIYEDKLKKQIPKLVEITDSVSSEVRAQYEGSPYPRWVNLGLHLKPISISNVVNQIELKLYDNTITEVEKPEILIAGCGTGQHSIETASKFKSSKVLAIDLSLSSLAYAKRKTEEQGIENINYMQADILNLKQLNEQFDIIECAGTLVCMKNPLLGWQVLTDCLKPSGLMKIGLYSELARQNIVKIREEIKQRGSGSSNAEMRSFRHMMLKSDKNYHKQVFSFTDFYSLSELKDLLFHVQEHRFTIPQIQDYLDTLGLRFCGFETKAIVSHFKQTNTTKDDPYDLDKWQAYEEANQRAFAGMYQFWCQKVDGD